MGLVAFSALHAAPYMNTNQEQVFPGHVSGALKGL